MLARFPRGILLLLSLTGCANWSRHGISPHPPEKIRVAVAPVQLAIQIKRLQNIESVPDPLEARQNERGAIESKMKQATQDVARDFEVLLSSSYFFEVVPFPAPSTATLTAAQIQEIGKASGAQAVLVVKISGYGAVKKSWLFYLIGSGLVEGLVEGVAVSAAVGSPWAAVGIGVEEAAQEAATWGGGAYLFNRFWSPVILESELISVADGHAIWSESALQTNDRKALKVLAPEERKKREVRLRLTARRAAKELVEELEQKAWANLRKADRRHKP